ncbi:hypothetical protein EAE96_001921 [Botrytis aclada]|nr:hypothetical protein EAE96_001921 [Botrytis aclada]
MDLEVPVPKNSKDVQDGGSVQKAVELVGKMLEQIQVELEKMLSQRGEVPPDADALESEKDESQKRYKDLESDYRMISEELKVFGRQMASAPDKSGRVQAELKLAQAKKDIEKLKAEVENLQTQCNDYQAQAHQPPQNVQKLETQLEELKNQNEELQKEKLEAQQGLEFFRKEAKKHRDWVKRSHVPEECRPSFEWQGKYGHFLNSVSDIASGCLDLKKEPEIKTTSKEKMRDILLQIALKDELHPGARKTDMERAIFEFFSDEILLQPGFGLDDEFEGKKMEAGLADFEEKIQNASGDDVLKRFDYYEWRRLTYKCGKPIRKQDAETPIIAFAKALKVFLRPVPKNINGRFEEGVLSTCREAFTMCQGLRAEPGLNFKIHFPERGVQVVVHQEGKLKETAVYGDEAGGYPEGDVATVAYTLMGGLMFEDVRTQGEWVPLVPARVIVKTPQGP